MQRSSKKAGVSQNHKKEFRMARKMFGLIFTDFWCWVPLCVACILAQSNLIAISPAMYVWIIGFVLPILSSINPFLYVIVDEISNYFEEKQKKLKAKEIMLPKMPKSKGNPL